MELLAKLKVENIYLAKDYKDPKTQEVITEGKWRLQTFERTEGEQGMQMKLIDISMPEEEAKKLQNKIGETVTIKIKPFVFKGTNKVGYYGI